MFEVLIVTFIAALFVAIPCYFFWLTLSEKRVDEVLTEAEEATPLIVEHYLDAFNHVVYDPECNEIYCLTEWQSHNYLRADHYAIYLGEL